MTRIECENRILELLEEIDNIYRTYSPEGGLSLFTDENGELHANNQYWEDLPPIRVTRFDDGEVEHWEVKND